MKLYPDDATVRRVARQNGWLILAGLSPVMLFAGASWFFESPSAFRFLAGVILVPTVFALIGLAAIWWGKRDPLAPSQPTAKKSKIERELKSS